MPTEPPRFLPSLRRAAARPAFWIAVAREAVPVAGVFAFGWSAFAAALFFLLESWLLMSLRAATEITIDPRYAGADLPTSTGDAVRKVLKHLSYVLFFMLLLVGLFAFFILFVAFSRADLVHFVTEEWRTPAVYGGFALLLVTLALDTVRFARGYATRSAADAARADLVTKLAFYRVPALVPAAFLISVAQHYGFGPHALVASIAILSIAIEGAPEAIVAWIERPRDDDRRNGTREPPPPG